MKKTFIVHPLFFAVYPALLLFSHNMFRIEPVAALTAIVVIVLLTSLLWMLLNFILKNTAKTALIISLSVMWFFYFSPVFLTLREWTALIFFSLKQRHFFPVWSIVFAFAATFLTIKRSYFKNLTKILNLVSSALIVFCLIDMATYSFKSEMMPAARKARRNINIKRIDMPTPKSSVINVTAGGPDVYYIILDSYLSYGALKKYYNFNNRDFYEYLTKKGFYIAQKSLSNYSATEQSLYSSLNMEYFDKREAANHKYKVMDIFKSKGYKCITVGRFSYRYADLNISYEKHDAHFSKYVLYKYLFSYTPLNQALDIYLAIFSPSSHKKEVQYYFGALKKISAIKGPKFVFAHILSPHFPFFVFGPNGEELSLNQVFKLDSRKIYVYQVMFINKKVQELVDIILSESRNPPIIILQADHGYTSDNPTIYQLDERWVTERMSILNAYYLPGAAKMSLYDSITPVNTFRVIFNYYFNANYPLLKDENWFSSFESRQQKLVNVTHRIKDIP